MIFLTYRKLNVDVEKLFMFISYFHFFFTAIGFIVFEHNSYDGVFLDDLIFLCSLEWA